MVVEAVEVILLVLHLEEGWALLEVRILRVEEQEHLQVTVTKAVEQVDQPNPRLVEDILDKAFQAEDFRLEELVSLQVLVLINQEEELSQQEATTEPVGAASTNKEEDSARSTEVCIRELNKQSLYLCLVYGKIRKG